AYKAPQYDMQQFSQFLTPPMSPVQYPPSSYTGGENERSDTNNSDNNYDNNSDSSNDYNDKSEEDADNHYPPSRQYYHFRDGYVSDGTDGGYLEDNSAKEEDTEEGGGDAEVENHYDNY